MAKRKGGVGKRGVGKGNSKKNFKQALRAQFEARHIDQVWEDVRKEKVHDGDFGPVGTTGRVELDDDLPAQGKHYCPPCSRYFMSEAALVDHQGTKPHKRRLKALQGPKPHSQKDADIAGGMGAPDNGPQLRPHLVVPSAMDLSGVISEMGGVNVAV